MGLMERLLDRLRKLIPTPVLDFIRPAYHYSLAVASALFYRFPGRQLTVIGVTGTKGKSTTCALAASVLETGGAKVGMISGIVFKVGENEIPNETMMTSLGRFRTQKLLRQMVKSGCTHAVLEVSSHALHWHRVWGIPFCTAVFTNLSKDHMELHKTMENYRAAKGKLFAKLAKGRAGKTSSVVNGDDTEAPFFLEFLADQKYVFGKRPEAAELTPLAHTVIADRPRVTEKGSSFTVRADEESFEVVTRLPGEFNVSNALAAVAIGRAHGIAAKDIVRGIDAVKGVAGRLERIEAGQPFSIVVDFAHTPTSFDAALGALRPITAGRLITVFGAPGNRDSSKFPAMGAAAAKYSDFMVLTEDDPGTEDPVDLVKPLIEGIGAAGKSESDYAIELDRRKAIRKAFAMAKRGDTVALLAKGHHTTMRYADGHRPWDDRVVAAEEAAKLSRE